MGSLIWWPVQAWVARFPALSVFFALILIGAGWWDRSGVAALLAIVVVGAWSGRPYAGSRQAETAQRTALLGVVLVPVILLLALIGNQGSLLAGGVVVIALGLAAGLQAQRGPDWDGPVPRSRQGGGEVTRWLAAAAGCAALLWGPAAWQDVDQRSVLCLIILVGWFLHESGEVLRTCATLGAISVVVRLAGWWQGADAEIFLGVASCIPLAIALAEGGSLRAALAAAVGVALVLFWRTPEAPGPAWISGMAALAGLAVWRLVPAARRGSSYLTLPPSWRYFTWAKLRSDPVYTLLAQSAGPWGRVLDAGCGHGLAALVAQRRGDVTHYCGLDLNPLRLAMASRLLQTFAGDPAFWQLACVRLPGPTRPLADTVLALDILHYWPPPEQQELLHWLKSCVAPGGRCWLREASADDAQAGRILAGEYFTTTIGLNPAGALHLLPEATLRHLLTTAGFSVVSVQPAGGANRLWQLRVS